MYVPKKKQGPKLKKQAGHISEDQHQQTKTKSNQQDPKQARTKTGLQHTSYYQNK